MSSHPRSASWLPAPLAAAAVLALAGCHAILGLEPPASTGGDGGVCEAVVETDVDHCGACDAPCGDDNGIASCAAGSCSISCEPGFEDCDDDPRKNGCEVDLGTDPEHCGTCMRECPTLANTEATCAPGGVCGLVCSTGFGNCEAASADCETSLVANVDHCGACQHDCEGGPCSSSRCQAFDLTTTAFRPAQLAVGDDAFVYFVRRKPAPPFDLMRVAKAGGSPPELLATINDVNTIAMAGDFVYWSEAGTIRRVEKVPGGTPTTVVPSLAPVSGRGFTVDESFIYYCSGFGMQPGPAEGLLHKRSTSDPSTEIPLGSATGACMDPLVDATRLYWVANEGQVATVYSASKLDGSDVQPLTTLCQINAAAQDAEALYYLASCTPGGPITRVDKVTGFATRLLDGETPPTLFAVDDTHIYTFGPFIAQSIDLRRYDKTGAGKVTLVSTPIATTTIVDFVHDADALYWSDGSQFKMRKLAK